MQQHLIQISQSSRKDIDNHRCEKKLCINHSLASMQEPRYLESILRLVEDNDGPDSCTTNRSILDVAQRTLHLTINLLGSTTLDSLEILA